MDVISAESENASSTQEEQSFLSKRLLPLLPKSGHADAEEMSLFWEQANQFFQTSAQQKISSTETEPTSKSSSSKIPALLAPYRNMSGISFDYPFWIAEKADQVPEGLFMPVSELLRGALQEFAPEENQAKTLRDNLSRIETCFRQNMDSAEPSPFQETLQKAIDDTQAQLSFSGEEKNLFDSDLKKLVSTLPASGTVVPFSDKAPLFVLSALLKARMSTAQTAFSDEVNSLIMKLKDLLQIEQNKQPDERVPERIQQTLGFASSLVNPSALSKVLAESASVSMSKNRKQRIERTISTLESNNNPFWEQTANILLHDSWFEQTEFSWVNCFPSSKLISSRGEYTALDAIDVFDEQMEEIADFFAALRIAKLEIENRYHGEIHDAFFNNFDWKRMTAEEMAMVPPTILIEDETSITTMPQSLSNLLLSAKPIKVVVIKNSFDGVCSGAVQSMVPERDDSFEYRPELGLWGVAQRKSFVCQSSVSQLEHLIQGFHNGLKAANPSFFHVLAPSLLEYSDQAYIKAGAAVESRDFPIFTYDPNKGLEWGSRFLVSANPQPEKDWTTHDLEVISSEDEVTSLNIAFTPADFIALFTPEKTLYDVPPEFWKEDRMVHLSKYLQFSAEDKQDYLPFIWTLDEENVLHRSIPNLVITETSRERLETWKFVQDFGGTNNYHAKQAAQKERAEAQQENEAVIASLKAEHQAEIERVQRETAAEAMERLSAVLLNLDSMQISAPFTSDSRSAGAPPSTEKTSEDQQAETAVDQESPAADEDEELSEEAWLESFRCTTCNECTELNPVMFQYNADKQAFISDVNAGTYKEMVVAAEACPAKCIHPGLPINKDEPGLEALVKRAEVFM